MRKIENMKMTVIMKPRKERTTKERKMMYGFAIEEKARKCFDRDINLRPSFSNMFLKKIQKKIIQKASREEKR